MWGEDGKKGNKEVEKGVRVKKGPGVGVEPRVEAPLLSWEG